MKHIECKAQWLSRPLKTKTAMTGFEGPAAKTEVDDGFGIPTLKGMVTSSYNAYFKVTGRDDQNCDLYDGSIDIPDTPANRYKIAQHVRAKDLRVKDRNLEREILAQNPPMAREKRPKNIQHFVDMPDNFDGSKIVLRNNSMAIVDEDPIEDPHAQDAEFTEVKADATAVEPALPAPFEPEAKTSAEEAKAGAVAPASTSAPRGFDPKAMKARAQAAREEAKPAQE